MQFHEVKLSRTDRECVLWEELFLFRILLKSVCSLLSEKKYFIGNIDTTICLQLPKIAEHIPAMKNAIAYVMEIDVERISIKATTNEKLGFIGREEGVSCYAVALIHF